jgi:hypothetical protein
VPGWVRAFSGARSLRLHTAIIVLTAALFIADATATSLSVRAAQITQPRLSVSPTVPTDQGDRVPGPATVYVEAPGAAQVFVVLWPVDQPRGGRRIGTPLLIGRADRTAELHTFPWAADEPFDYVELFAIAVGPLQSQALAFSEPVTLILNQRPASAGQTGAISGEVGYPSDGIPPLLVYAIRTDVAGPRYRFVRTQPNQRDFVIDGLEPGVYVVLAYLENGPPDFAGAYTEAVRCGLTVDCRDHSLIPITVRAGETTAGVQVRDWYTPPGVFPLRPAEP